MLRREDDRAEVFKVTKQVAATNRDVVGDKCMKNERGILATSDQEKHLTWTEKYQRMLNEEPEWDKAKLSVSEPSVGPQSQFAKESIKKALNRVQINVSWLRKYNPFFNIHDANFPT